MEFIWIILLVLLLFLSALFTWKQISHLPPGPYGLPLVGYAPFIDRKDPHKSFYELCKKYGDIYCLNVLNERFVVINDYETLKLLFARSCVDRPDLASVRLLYDGEVKGILNASGEYWAAQRKFIAKYLKHIMDSGQLESAIRTETDLLLGRLGRAALRGDPVVVNEELLAAVFFVTWRLMFGKATSESNPILKFVREEGTRYIQEIHVLFFYGFLPKWLRNRIPLEMLTTLKQVKLTVKTLLEEEKRLMTRANNSAGPSTFLEFCMSEVDSRSCHEEHKFGDEDILELVVDLLIAGSETSATTIIFCLLYCAKYPEIQEKLHKEITTFSKGPIIELDDLNKMPHFRSFMSEVLRTTTIVPLGLARTNHEDLIVRGYRIPKDSVIIGNNYAVHRSEKHWQDFSQFKEDRFLDDKGDFQPPGIGFVPFSTGKRQCPGSAVAKWEIFLITATIIKTFKLTAADPEGMVLEPQPGIILQPPLYEMNLNPRENLS